MLKRLRVGLAAVFWLGITLLFLDISGVLHHYLGWMAKMQFLPAVLALNTGVIVALALLTLVFGRVYCSIICPLGVFQDGISWLRAHRSKKPYQYHKEMVWLRYGVWVVFVASLVAGGSVLVSLLAPYSAYGRMVGNLLQPLYLWGNNLLSWAAERAGSYAFYPREVWFKGVSSLVVALVTLAVVGVMAFRGGRSYCNDICPVGTTLSFLSRFAMFRPVIDTQKCRHCKACEHHCKARCIAIGKDNARIDYSRCVDCFNCLEECKFDALQYRFAWRSVSTKKGPMVDGTPKKADASTNSSQNVETATNKATNPTAEGRRAFLAGTALAVGGAALSGITARAQEAAKKVDGGLAEVLPKQAPPREVPLTPPGSVGVRDFYRRCNACQLCVAACPNGILRPSELLEHLMEPEMGFERGFCRPECTRCSQVCPTGSIRPIGREEKTQYHVGTARVNPEACISATGASICGKCHQICPSGAISLVDNPANGHRLPVVAESLCTGCGACEHYCPVRPVSAITVNGKFEHL